MPHKLPLFEARHIAVTLASLAALSAAFISTKVGPGNTGYVGPFLPAIEAAVSAAGGRLARCAA